MPRETDSATATSVENPDLTAAAAAVDTAGSVVENAFKHLVAEGDVDADQVIAYDLAHAAAAIENARAVLDYGEKGDEEAHIACAFVADAIHDVATRLMGREQEWGAEQGALDSAIAFGRPYRSPEFLSELCGIQGPRHLDDDFVMVQDTFRRFAEERIRPIAEEIHRNNEDIPEEIIEGLSELGTFGVSIPEEYEGFAAEGEGEYLSMVAATEEIMFLSLSR